VGLVVPTPPELGRAAIILGFCWTACIPLALSHRDHNLHERRDKFALPIGAGFGKDKFQLITRFMP